MNQSTSIESSSAIRRGRTPTAISTPPASSSAPTAYMSGVDAPPRKSFWMPCGTKIAPMAKRISV